MVPYGVVASGVPPTHLSLSRRGPIKDVLADWMWQGGSDEREQRRQQMADFGLILGSLELWNPPSSRFLFGLACARIFINP